MSFKGDFRKGIPKRIKMNLTENSDGLEDEIWDGISRG
jgi:hypothetical protein